MNDKGGFTGKECMEICGERGGGGVDLIMIRKRNERKWSWRESGDEEKMEMRGK